MVNSYQCTMQTLLYLQSLSFSAPFSILTSIQRMANLASPRQYEHSFKEYCATNIIFARDLVLRVLYCKDDIKIYVTTINNTGHTSRCRNMTSWRHKVRYGRIFNVPSVWPCHLTYQNKIVLVIWIYDPICVNDLDLDLTNVVNGPNFTFGSQIDLFVLILTLI